VNDREAADIYRAVEHFRTLAVQRRREFGGSEAANVYDRIADAVEGAAAALRAAEVEPTHPLLHAQPTIMRHAEGGYVWTECVQCGPDVKVDEDGCCNGCGTEAVRYGKEAGNE
jgi:hypothetical protein